MVDILRKEFDSYRIYYNTNGGARILCISSGKQVGVLEFFKDNEPIRQNYVSKHSGSVDEILNIHFPISRFNDIINILRYEKPLYLILYTDSWMGTLATYATEPTGEQEP